MFKNGSNGVQKGLISVSLLSIGRVPNSRVNTYPALAFSLFFPVDFAAIAYFYDQDAHNAIFKAGNDSMVSYSIFPEIAYGFSHG